MCDKQDLGFDFIHQNPVWEHYVCITITAKCNFHEHNQCHRQDNLA